MDLLSDQVIQAEQTAQQEKRKCVWNYIQHTMPDLATLLLDLQAAGFKPFIPPETVDALAAIAISVTATTAR